MVRNVWLGPKPDLLLYPSSEDDNEPTFDILIEASDLAQPPDSQTLKRVGELSYSASLGGIDHFWYTLLAVL